MNMKCPACKSDRTVQGRFLDQIGGGVGQVFRPKGLKMVTLTGSDIRIPDKDKFASCLDCGLLWSVLDKKKLTSVLTKHGNKKTKERLGLAD